jgi:hypothetical protein
MFSKNKTTTWILDNNLSGKKAWDIRQQCESKGLTLKRINANHLYVTGTVEQHGCTINREESISC